VITRNENGFEATFPNAEIYIQKRELALPWKIKEIILLILIRWKNSSNWKI
jgi:hypothetical protein